MPDFSELYAGMVKRHKATGRHPSDDARIRRAKTFAAIEAVYGGDNEYIPVPAVATELVELQAQAEANINAIFYSDFARDPRRFTDFVQPPLTFMAKGERVISHNHPLDEALKLKRQGCDIAPMRDLVGADFADFGDRKLLAELGYFSVDLPKHRAKRDLEAQREAYLDQAYDVLHLDRKAVHAMIAAKLEAKRFDGIWARSTGEYSEACRKMDMTVLARSPAIAQSISELSHD